MIAYQGLLYAVADYAHAVQVSTQTDRGAGNWFDLPVIRRCTLETFRAVLKRTLQTA